MFLCSSGAKNEEQHIFWFSFQFSRGQNRKSLSTVFFCPETRPAETLATQAMSLTESVRPESFHCLSSVYSQNKLDHSNIFWIRESTYFKKQDTCDWKLTDRLFSDLHGYCLLKQKALLISCGNFALIFYRIFETISWIKPNTEAMNKWFVDYVNRYKGF